MRHRMRAVSLPDQQRTIVEARGRICRVVLNRLLVVVHRLRQVSSKPGWDERTKLKSSCKSLKLKPDLFPSHLFQGINKGWNRW